MTIPTATSFVTIRRKFDFSSIEIGRWVTESGTVYSEEAKAGLYPKGQHRAVINEAFENYFQALGSALHRQQAKAG